MKKSTLRIIAIILGVVLLGGVIAFSTGLFAVDEDKQDEYFGRKVNEDNLYTVECLELYDTNDGDGISVDVDEKKGGIKLNGTANVDKTYTVGTVTVPAGTYTLTACDGASRAGVYVTASAGSTTYNFDFTPDNTVQISEEVTLTITIHVAEDAELNNVWILPVIVEGDEAADFYK